MRRRLIAACLVSFFSAEVKYSSHKMTLKTARGGKKKQKKNNTKLNMTQTQLTFSSNSYWTICVKICILDNIIAAVLFICISFVNNKRSMLRFHSITAPITEGGLPVVFTVCFCLFFTYIISNFLMQPRFQGSLLPALRSERERERRLSFSRSLGRVGENPGNEVVLDDHSFLWVYVA